MKQKLLKIFNIVLSFAFVLSVGFTIYLSYWLSENQSSLNDQFMISYKPGIMESDSMTPCIKENAIFIVQKTNSTETFHKGDIVYFSYDKKLIVHRIFSVNNATREIRTKGDNNNIADAFTLKPSQIKGKVVCCWNWTADVAASLQNPTQRLLIIGSVVFVATAVISISIYFKSRKGKDD